MSSFYGGKQGRSYRIVKHYDSVEDMVNAFSQGNEYTDVGYGEYVIIDTIVNRNEKSNPENGLLYRRGYNFDEPLNEAGRAAANAEQKIEGNTSHEKWSQYVEQPGGGAIYIGQIVGPKGEAIPIELLNWNDFLEAADQTGQEPKTEEGILTPVPGYENGEYKDTIDYGYCTLKNINGDVTGAYLSFNFPYTVFNFEAELVEPYNLETVIEEQDDSIGHPYYKHYKFSIPKGKHGQEVSEIGIYQRNQNGTYTKLSNISDLSQRDNLFFGYKLKNYDNSQDGETTALQGLVPYKVIKNTTEVKRDDRNYPSKIKFDYTDGTSKEVKYNIIDSITVDERTKQITIKQSGENTPTITYTPREVVKVERNSNNELVVLYNDNTSASFPVTEIADVKLDGDNIKIGFRNLSQQQAEASFPSSMITIEDDLTYLNFGSVIKGQHIYRNYDNINELPEGGLTGDHAGWIVTVGNSTDGYDLYAYDYNRSNWYSIEHIDADFIDPKFSIILSEEDSSGMPVSGSSKLNEDGIWLIKEKEATILNLYISQSGNIRDVDNNISITPAEVINKFNEGYKINALLDSNGDSSYTTKLTLYRIYLDKIYFTFVFENSLMQLSIGDREVNISTIIDF